MHNQNWKLPFPRMPVFRKKTGSCLFAFQYIGPVYFSLQCCSVSATHYTGVV